MSLETVQKQWLLDVIQHTGDDQEALRRQQVIPEDYLDYLDYTKQVEREEQVLTLPGAEVPVRVIVTRALDRKFGFPIHVNFHGGGFILPQNEDDDLYCARIAAGIHGIVVDVDYVTSDKQPFPAAYNQGYAVTQWVFQQCQGWGGDSERISAGGHSAGGNLVAAIAIKAAKTHDFALCLQVLDYAANDNYMPLTQEGMERSAAFSTLYADGNVELLKTTAVSPVFASLEELRGLPPALIVEAGQCPFVEANRRYGRKLLQAGNQVRHIAFPDSRHGFTVRMLDQWREAQQIIVGAITAAGT